jgi:CTP synthase
MFYAIFILMEDQKIIKTKGGTMRLGSYPCKLEQGTRIRKSYNKEMIIERHRHRYEFNNKFKNQMKKHGLVFSGLSPNGNLVEIVELKDHPWFVACQFHPEFQSTPLKAHPLFRDFIAASLG